MKQTKISRSNIAVSHNFKTHKTVIKNRRNGNKIELDAHKAETIHALRFLQHLYDMAPEEFLYNISGEKRYPDIKN